MQQITFATNLGHDTLEYAKLLVRSLKENLDSDQHQILIFIDADNENTLEYFMSIQDSFHNMKIIQNDMGVPVGYQWNTTLITEEAEHDIISYLQSDMVIGPHYDTEILKHVKRGRILSATRVEPPLHGESPVTITKNFGLDPTKFNLEEWNSFSDSVKRDELIPYFFAPITYYKDDWMALGGYDTVFRRSREDSDFVQRCLHANIELVQTFSANVYHFTCVSSRGKNWHDKTDASAQERVQLQQIADRIELYKFIRKWGNFNHGEQKLYKLNMDVVVKNYTLDQVSQIEPFFSRVWLQSDEDKHVLLNKYEANQQIANILNKYTVEQWESYKHLYNSENFDYIFNVGEPTEYSVKVEIDFSKIQNGNTFLTNLQNLYVMLKDCEPGEYELDGVLVSVHRIDVLPVNIRVENPQFDYSLLTVYL